MGHLRYCGLMRKGRGQLNRTGMVDLVPPSGTTVCKTNASSDRDKCGRMESSHGGSIDTSNSKRSSRSSYHSDIASTNQGSNEYKQSL